MYEVHGTGNESRVKMWVTAARKAGPTTICTGWLVRYPEADTRRLRRSRRAGERAEPAALRARPTARK